MSKISGKSERIINTPEFQLHSVEKDKWFHGSHIQGIAQGGRHIVLTSTLQNHSIMLASQSDQKSSEFVYKESCTLPSDYYHAGGIDIVEYESNSWLVPVPVWKKNKKTGAIFFYWLTSSPADSGPNRFIFHKMDYVLNLWFKPYAVGISQVTLNQEPYIVLCVVCNSKGNIVQFFISPMSYPLKHFSNLSSVFDPKRVYGYWKGYDNNLSLFTEGNLLYLIGFKSSCIPLVNFHCWGHRADIYLVSISDGSLTGVTKQNRFKFHGSNQVSFRWGASALKIPGEEGVEIIACGCNPVTQQSGKFFINMNRFDL